jgi:hypothetical protein
MNMQRSSEATRNHKSIFKLINILLAYSKNPARHPT